MARFQIEHGISFKKILYSWPVIVIFIIILGSLATKTFRSWRNYREAAKEYETLQKKIAEVERNKKEVEENLALLKDEFGRDRIIREQFDAQKKDEKVIIILDEDKQPKEGRQDSANLSIFTKIKNFIANIFSRD